jgi:hypothetical protein
MPDQPQADHREAEGGVILLVIPGPSDSEEPGIHIHKFRGMDSGPAANKVGYCRLWDFNDGLGQSPRPMTPGNDSLLARDVQVR